MTEFELHKTYTGKQIDDSFVGIHKYGEDCIGGHFLICNNGTKRYSFVSSGMIFASGFTYDLIFIYPPGKE